MQVISDIATACFLRPRRYLFPSHDSSLALVPGEHQTSCQRGVCLRPPTLRLHRRQPAGEAHRSLPVTQEHPHGAEPPPKPRAVCDCRVFVLLNEASIYNAPPSPRVHVIAARLSKVTCAPLSPLLHTRTDQLRVKELPLLSAIRQGRDGGAVNVSPSPRFIEMTEVHLRPSLGAASVSE